MRPATAVALILVGLTGLVQLILGMLFWTGHSTALIPLHRQLGLVFVISLWALAALVARAGAPPGLAGLAFLWGVVVAVVGMLHDRLLPGEALWVIKTLHLLISLVALGLARTLMAGITRAHAPSLVSKRGAV